MTATKIIGYTPSGSREILRLAYRVDQRISSKLQQAEELRALAGQARGLAPHRTPRTMRADIASDGPEEAEKPSNMKDALSKLAELEDEIAADISQLIDQKREIQELIRSLPSPEQQLLLELKYLHFRTWQDVADTMNYSYRQIQRLHQQILRKLDKNPRIS